MSCYEDILQTYFLMKYSKVWNSYIFVSEADFYRSGGRTHEYRSQVTWWANRSLEGLFIKTEARKRDHPRKGCPGMRTRIQNGSNTNEWIWMNEWMKYEWMPSMRANLVSRWEPGHRIVSDQMSERWASRVKAGCETGWAAGVDLGNPRKKDQVT